MKDEVCVKLAGGKMKNKVSLSTDLRYIVTNVKGVSRITSC